MNYHPSDKEILFPEAKINLGLFVTRKREDGYHILQTLFYPINWRDSMEILATDTEPGDVQFKQSGIVVDCDPESNLCVKAYRLLQARFPDLPGVCIHLDKQIPFGAGLGGGSSDGAHALLMLRKLFNLPVTDTELEDIAAKMGADCAFFCRCADIYNTCGNGGILSAQYCEGVGHELISYPLSLRGKYLVIVKPPFGVSTKEAYSNVHPMKPETDLCELLKLPLEEWRSCIKNDFENSVFPLHPELQKAKDTLYDHGAIYASMSGSGSALFGIFDREQEGCESWFSRSYEVRGDWALV